MQLRPVHSDLHLPRLYEFIRSNPLGIFTTAIPSPTQATIQSSHIPWVLDVLNSDELASSPTEPNTSPPQAILRGHLARANPQCKALIEAVESSGSSTLKDEILILFNGPANHYVTPKFYVETKPSTGKVVPTWIYSAVQVYGTLKVHLASDSEFTAKQLDDLSAQSEARLGYDGKDGRPKAWEVGESPDSYVGLLKKAIIGLEVRVDRIGGKWKMNQELKDGDRHGVLEGFEKIGTKEALCLKETIMQRAEIQERSQGDKKS